jgi:hypothetical protein
MNTRNLSVLSAALLGGALVWGLGPARCDEPEAGSEGVEVQARGPVHEAFAEPAETRSKPSPVEPKQPPQPIEETPPDQKPEGDNVQWIPGYWAWDEDRSDFLWVSGFWREVPPGRQWVPGFWQEVEDGWQWVPGFWKSTQQEEMTYLPQPPPSIDRGPSVPASGEESTYVPGCWVYRQARYLWRPGFWIPFRIGWVWIPAHYVWTPAGYLFVEGYWDHPLEDRGLLFAPVVVDRRFLTRRNWFYTPSYIVRPDFLISALFVRPANCHYYFGDYFEDRYERRGFVPWIDYRVNRLAFDPNYAYYRHRFARQPGWDRSLHELYVARRRGEVPRPPRTLAQQNQVVRGLTGNRSADAAVARNINLSRAQNVTALAPLKQVHNLQVTSLASLAGVRGGDARGPNFRPKVVKLQAVPRDQQAQVRKDAGQFQQAVKERRQAEARIFTQGATPHKPTDQARTVKIPLPKPPAPPENRKPLKEPPPPAPASPKHEQRPVPPHEPEKAPRPPRQGTRTDVPPPRDAKPPVRETIPPAKDKRPAEPPKKQTPPPRRDAQPPPPKDGPPPVKDKKPPEPPRRETPPPPPPKKETPPPPPPKKEAPPPVKDKKPPEPPRKDKPPA